MDNNCNLFDGMDGVPEEALRFERNKAKKIRKSRWWQQKIANGICHYCGQKFSPSQLTMDHKVPLARGGKSSKGNCVASCKQCNSQKKASLPVEWQKDSGS